MSTIRCRWCHEDLTQGKNIFSREDLVKDNNFRTDMTCPDCGRRLNIEDERDVEAW